MKLKEIINSYIMKDTDIAWHEFINNGSLFSNPKEKEEKTTIPPRRFSEAMLVKEMETKESVVLLLTHQY